MTARPWRDVPISSKLFLNMDADDQSRGLSALENSFVDELGAQHRFPGLRTFASLPNNDVGRIYLYEWRGNLMAASSLGYLYRIDDNGNVENVTGTPLSGGQRAIFAETADRLLIAAGGPILQFKGDRTELLPGDPPKEVTHVQVIDGYVIANERYSQRFFHSEANEPESWDALDVFIANSKADDISAILVTPTREIMVAGYRSMEQFDRIADGDSPFFRRYGLSEGIYTPYGLTFSDNVVWALSSQREFVRFSGQTYQTVSQDIGLVLDKIIDDWSEAWIGGFPDQSVNIIGQRFLIIQFPNATNPYGTKGRTFAFDLRQRKFSELYGWDSATGTPTRWPGWSHWNLWERQFVGGSGVVYEMTDDTHAYGSQVQRMLGRTAILDAGGEQRIDNARFRIRRGTGTNTTECRVRVRVKRDNKQWTGWREKRLGRAGQPEQVIELGGFGCAHTWQFEWEITDDCPFTMRKFEIQTSPLGY